MVGEWIAEIQQADMALDDPMAGAQDGLRLDVTAARESLSAWMRRMEQRRERLRAARQALERLRDDGYPAQVLPEYDELAARDVQEQKRTVDVVAGFYRVAEPAARVTATLGSPKQKG